MLLVAFIIVFQCYRLTDEILQLWTVPDAWMSRYSNYAEVICIVYSLVYCIMRLILPFGSGFDMNTREDIEIHWSRISNEYVVD